MRAAIGIITGIFIILGILGFVGIAALFPTLIKLNYHYVLQAICATLAIMIFDSIRLKLVLNAQKYPMGLWNATKIHAATNTLNLLTPVIKIGGIPLRVNYVSRTNVPSIISCASVVGEIVTESISFFTTLTIILFYLAMTHSLPQQYLELSVALLIVSIIVLLMFLQIIFSRRNLEKFIRKWILRFTTVNATLAAKQFTCSINAYISNKPLLYSTFFISFFCRILEFARIYAIFLALGFQVSLGLVLIVWVLEAFFSGLPWIPGGIGLVEIGSISALTLLNIPIAIATSLIIINRMISHWTPLAIGSVIMSRLSRGGIKCEI